jgi:hypothetical protein
MQHPIYFWNIKMQHLQHLSEGRLNTWKKHLKTLENHCKHTQYLDKTYTTYVWNIRNIRINTLVTYV